MSYTGVEAVCFTGHRHIQDSSSELIKSILKQTIRVLVFHGAHRFLAGGALGFDTMAALSVLELKGEFPHLSLELILPCKNQTARWSEADKAVYENILDSADRVEYLHESYTSTCMHDRNRRLVDESDLCIAYCEHNGGGTAYTMAYALKSNIEVINIADMI